MVHWKAVLRVFQYVKETPTMGLFFDRRKFQTELICYCDSDYAGDVDTRKSTTGVVFSK